MGTILSKGRWVNSDLTINSVNAIPLLYIIILIYVWRLLNKPSWTQQKNTYSVMIILYNLAQRNFVIFHNAEIGEGCQKCCFRKYTETKRYHCARTVLTERLDMLSSTLQWSHNERDGVSNHRHLDCFLNCLFRRKSKKTSKLRVTGLCEGNLPVTGGFPSQRASKAENEMSTSRPPLNIVCYIGLLLCVA